MSLAISLNNFVDNTPLLLDGDRAILQGFARQQTGIALSLTKAVADDDSDRIKYLWGVGGAVGSLILSFTGGVGESIGAEVFGQEVPPAVTECAQKVTDGFEVDIERFSRDTTASKDFDRPREPRPESREEFLDSLTSTVERPREDFEAFTGQADTRPNRRS